MPDVINGPPLAYTVREQNGRFEVCADSGRTVMICNDDSSASHYSSLLNEAYKAGYKLGCRDGRGK